MRRSSVSCAVPFLAMLLLAGCACRYEGKLPDLAAKGAEAEREIARFTMSESVWRQGTSYVRMGEDRDPFRLPSVMPVFRSVSPEAADQIADLKAWNTAGQTVLAAALAYYFAASASAEQRKVVGFSLLGMAAAVELYGTLRLVEAEKIYNRDLRRRLQAPTAAMRFEF